ncbi:DUF2913 family protein (plasmid) [Yersinia sp. HM-2024]|uniref:DUF2913 family protein n=1 Tax=Yersinia sp. HM-2024 TaxID=3344550 RepID=UPI00370DDB20
MNNNIEDTTTELSHLAFCALIALHLAHKEGKVSAPTAENLFLVRWLSLAQKQKRFSKRVAIDIQWLLDKGRQQGLTGKLKQHLEYLWRSCTGALDKQSDLFRLTYATECLKEKGWDNAVMNKKEWHSEEIDELPPGTSGFYVEKEKLNAGFSVGGKQLQPVPFRVSGNLDEFIEVLAQYALIVNVKTSTPTYTQVELISTHDAGE